MKVEYNGIKFDSDLEINYYKHLSTDKEVINFIYHPLPIMVNKTNKYTPDFIVEYKDRVEVIETKGYNQFSFMRDNMIHNFMLSRSEQDLRNYILENDISIGCRNAIYKKIKYLQKFGFVDWNFKNPNTISNQRKIKLIESEKEIKELRNYKKACERYFLYEHKIIIGDKLTSTQQLWRKEFINKNIKKEK